MNSRKRQLLSGNTFYFKGNAEGSKSGVDCIIKKKCLTFTDYQRHIRQNNIHDNQTKKSMSENYTART